MNIAIIGAGNVGTALARSLGRAGHGVAITATNPEHARTAAAATGAQPTYSNAEAAAAADVVILAVPWTAIEAVAAEISDAVLDKVVVDVSNPMSATGASAMQGTSAAERTQDLLPNARVVKAFNTLFASVQADPSLHGTPADGFVAGDDADARTTVARLMRSMGLRVIDAGALNRARELEAVGLLHIALNMNDGWAWNTTFKLVGAPVEEPAARELAGVGA